jgi:nucleoside 2-deoxyribosyltransferase
MTVVGGIYREVCVDQLSDHVFGSGGRAAAALASTGRRETLHSYVAPDAIHSVNNALEPADVSVTATECRSLTTFRYLHSLAKPTLWPWPITPATKKIVVSGEEILLYGMVEGEAEVHGRRVVFDPQGSDPKGFRCNGSSAERLAVILNTHELMKATGTTDEISGVSSLTKELGAEVLIVKAGAVGARVYASGVLLGSVPPYRTSRVFKIGSGDIFSAAFFHGWVDLGLSERDAADYASRSTARYCETRSPTLVPPSHLAYLKPLRGEPQGYIYIAAPFFTLADLWLVEEAARALAEVGARPFSPFHEIGVGAPSEVATKDLDALKGASAVLAIASGADPGTIFEVGFAVSLGIPVIVVSQNRRPADMTMMLGTHCVVTDDFSSGVYLASWATRN